MKTDKKLKKMLILIALFIFLIICLFIILSFVLVKFIEINKVYPGEAFAINLGFEPSVQSFDQVSRFLEEDMEKNLINQVCEQGGYDISESIDKRFLINSFSVKNFYQENYPDADKHPLKFVFLDATDDEPSNGYVCAYLVIDDTDKNPLVPGIFSVNDPYIRR